MDKNLDFRYQFKFVCSLFHRDLSAEVKANYDLISSYFMKAEMNKKNSLIISLLNYNRSTPYPEYNVDKFYAYLMTECSLIKEEAIQIIEMVTEARNTEDRSSLKEISGQLRNIANSVIAERAYSDAKGNPTDYIRRIKDYDYVSSFSDKLSVTYLDEYSALEIMDEFLSPSKIMQSRYDFINKASHMGGWIPGQIVMVTSPPGGGKTLYMMSEANYMARNGHKCFYLAMGDMNISDFYIRNYAMDKEVPFYQATMDFLKAHDYGKQTGKNLGVSVTSASEVTAEEVVDYILTNLPDVDAVFLDYDSNFLVESSGSLYMDGGETYKTITKLKTAGKLVFIGSQPRTSYYATDYLDMNAAGESSRKQHTVDFIVSIGTNDEVRVPCGYISLVKARRAFNKFKVPYVRTIDGNMHQVPFAVYNEYRGQINDPNLTSDVLRLKIASSGSPTAQAMSAAANAFGVTAIPEVSAPAVNSMLNLSTLQSPLASIPSL